MKDSTLVILLVGGAALLFWAVSRGFISASPTGLGTLPGPGQSGVIVTPQPTQNYSGYLAASTAPSVSSALSSVLSGFGNLASGWLSSKASGASVPPQQGASAYSPSMGAQPSGPSPFATQSAYSAYDNTLVGPQIPDAVSYDATNGSAYAWAALADDNGYDPNYALYGV
jgi:hypothetical protein